MEPMLGDIVTIRVRQDGVRWVAHSFHGSPCEVPYLRIIRPAENGANEAFTLFPMGVEIIDRPVYEVGERVVGDRERVGAIIALHPEHARVRWDKRRIPLRGGGFLADYGSESDMPYWQLALDNRLLQGAFQ